MPPNNSLQATADAPSLSGPCGDSLLLGIVAAQFPRLCLSSGRWPPIVGMRTFTALLAVLLLATAGCTHFVAVKKIDKLHSGDALVFGKIRILRDGEEVTKDSNLVFNQAGHTGWSSARQFLTGDGILCAGLPAGDNYFFHIISAKGAFRPVYRYQFQPDEATLHLPQAGIAYYIGDITIDWTPPKSKTAKTGAFVGGTIGGGPFGGLLAIAMLPYAGGEALLSVQDNRAEAQKLFRERLQSDKELVPALLNLKTHQ